MSTREFKIGATGRLDDYRTKMHGSVGLNKFPLFTQSTLLGLMLQSKPVPSLKGFTSSVAYLQSPTQGLETTPSVCPKCLEAIFNHIAYAYADTHGLLSYMEF